MNGSVVISNLTKMYGKHAGISDLSLEIQPGEVMGFLGANGAGKTTTLRCLVGLLKPTSGSISINGYDPGTQHKQLMDHVGYLPGELRLYDELTGRQHLTLLTSLQLHNSSDRSNELCERLGLSQRDLNRPVRDYSRGMKQKIGLVQALQHDPSVLFLDEPTEGLDPLVQEQFFSILEEQASKNVTVLLSSHVMSEVERACHRVAIVRRAKLVTVDDISALKSARARHIRCRFQQRPPSDALDLAPAWNPVWNDHTLSLDVPAKESTAALRKLLEYQIEDVIVEEAGLDEALIGLYGAKDDQ